MATGIITDYDYEVIPQTDKERFKNALSVCKDFINNPDSEELKNKVKNTLPILRDLVEFQKRLENLCKNIKEITEPAIYEVREQAENYFKVGKHSFTTKINDINGLYERIMNAGTPAEKILEYTTITPKNAAECLGLSERAFEDTFGEFIDKTPRKPVIKAV